MTQDEAVSHWRKRSNAELDDAELYGEVLFHCHLALELAFKGIFIQEQNAPAPFIHDLGGLASRLHMKWTNEEEDDFDQLTEFAILARYGDERWFEKEATKSRAQEWLKKTERILAKLFS